MKIYFFIALLLFSYNALAQNQPAISAEEQAFYNKAMPVIKKEYKDLVFRTAGQLKGRTINADSLVSAMKKNNQLNNLNGADIEALTFLVMMAATKSAQEDLKTIMDETKAINRQKDKQRITMQNTSPVRKDLTHPTVNTKIATLNPGKDSLNDMSETQQLRLQMTMDRRSKMIAALSNIMKKISNTQDQIISNLK